MMNWVMPMPQDPNLASKPAQVNNLANIHYPFTNTSDNLNVENKKSSSYINKKKTNSKSKIVKVGAKEVGNDDSQENALSPVLQIEEALDNLVEGFDSSIGKKNSTQIESSNMNISRNCTSS